MSEVVSRSAEQATLERLRAGDEAAFVELVDRYHGSLMRLARMYVDTATLAEEVVQDAWIGFLESLDRFEGRSSLKTWLFRILVNCARARRRKEARSIPFSAAFREDEEGTGPRPGPFLPSWVPKLGGHWAWPPRTWQLPEERALAAETRACLERAIAALPLAQREVLTLRDVAGAGAAEVCNLLGLSDTNQRVLLHRARSRVRRAVEQHLREGRSA